MKPLAIFSILVVLGISIWVAQDQAAADRTAIEQPAAADHAVKQTATQTSPLEDLAWMVGRWVDVGEDSTVSTNCSWTRNRKFLTQSFSIAVGGQVSMDGTQVIGWDPIEKRIRSWTFDSEGGFGEGRWIKDGNRWLVKTSFVLASGERASSLSVFTYVDADSFRWQSIGREVAGELQPNIPEVTVVRQKPEKTERRQSRKEVSQ